MEKTTFFILFILYLILFGMKKNILISFHKKGILKWLSYEVFTYIFILLFIVLMVVGVLFTKNNDYANVSKGFDKYRNPAVNKRPHRYFDIDTYPDQ